MSFAHGLPLYSQQFIDPESYLQSPGSSGEALGKLWGSSGELWEAGKLWEALGETLGMIKMTVMISGVARICFLRSKLDWTELTGRAR